ncbi:pentatricopeptide repeat-containing protein At1g08070, chloroplastic-like [Coffea eugenioides]|uniref:pentatricopeptide repeat-containing protein At1g08070, chloroplastic-like n=1 Tax=Coffea eugenioides TaxID=49369 RepID=UPI000F615956|nr:pentatricopeptide repeat-containing protein At1g08070, chloroplastic-like [Coffea eugenioides]
MGFTLSDFPARTITTKTTTILQVPDNPKTLILEKCRTTRDLNQVHAHLIKTRLLHNPNVANPLLESAALLLPNPSINYALNIFHDLEKPDSAAYNAMIRGLTLKQSSNEAILFFRQMIEHLVKPDKFSFSSVLKACSRLKALMEGQQIHAQIFKCQWSCKHEELVNNALVYMYASCGEMVLARRVFDGMSERSTITWNSMFSGYVKSGFWEEVTRLFREMLDMEVQFDGVTLISVLTACRKLGDLELGQWIDDYVEVNGLMGNANLVTSLFDMYAKCGCVDAARRLFDRMPRKDVVAWSAMIAGYSQANRGKDALSLFHEMQKANVEPNEVTMVTVLSSCALLGALETGKWVHSYIKKKKWKLTVTLGTALVDFYAKCGCVDSAVEVFQEMPSTNVLSWTALIQGLASNGQGVRALEYYSLMQQQNIAPNDVTFIGVLCACSHAGLVDQGWAFFTSMTRDFGFEPRIEHCGCMVDILGRAGRIEEAYNFIKSMTTKPNAVVWRTLLASCRFHKNVEIAEESLKQVVRLEPAHAGDYILLSNVYASVGRLEDALRVRSQMKEIGVKKSPGCSLIELDGVIHEFLAEDSLHPDLEDIYTAIDHIMKRIKLAGYVPNTAEGRLDAEEDGKEASISHHSEKLAIAFGLLKTTPGATIRISKNLRICTDCHNAAKLISTVFDRVLVIRDRNRFHHFAGGTCSCNDFW